MANKKRKGEGGKFAIELAPSEMLKVERLLKVLDQVEGSLVYLGSEEKKWLSTAIDLFTPELPPGEYPI